MYCKEPTAKPSRKASELTEAELMAAIADGDGALLGELYMRYGRRIKAALRNWAPEMSLADVEDVTQEIFITLADTASKYQEHARFSGWLFGIAKKKLANWRKRSWVRLRFFRRNPAPVAVAYEKEHDSPSNRACLKQLVAQSLAKLPRHQREVIWLHFVEGLDGDEIAQALNIDRDTVYTRLFRARKTLLKKVNREAVLAVLSEDSK